MAVQQEVVQARRYSEETEPAMNAQSLTYSPWRFFYAMLAIAWSAFAHPFTSSVIDLNTGRVSHNGGDEGL